MCCLDTLPKAVTTKDAENYRLQMSRLHLIFQTVDNQDRVAAYYVANGLIDPSFLEACKEQENEDRKLDAPK